MWPDYDAEHYEALHNLDYYDGKDGAPGLAGWVMSYSEYENSRPANLSRNMSAFATEYLRRHKRA